MTAFADRKKRLAVARLRCSLRHVDQGAITIDRAVKVLPTAVHPNIRLKLTLPFRLRRSSSASSGVSFVS